MGCWSSYLTLGTQGNSFIINVDAGSTLEASLASDVVDSDTLTDEDARVLASSSEDTLLPPLPLPFDKEPSSLLASESSADCLVKLYDTRLWRSTVETCGHIPVVWRAEHCYFLLPVLASLDTQLRPRAEKSAASVQWLSPDSLQSILDLAEPELDSSAQMLHPGRPGWTWNQNDQSRFTAPPERKRTKSTFQSSRRSFRIGNGGDGALQNMHTAWYNVLAKSSSLSFGCAMIEDRVEDEENSTGGKTYIIRFSVTLESWPMRHSFRRWLVEQIQW